ncbi:SMC-Scp complex subunit ScpB [uncultured Microscilla sp.]|uniref:SMC-Scp complex subunit ScpB n=1 Tax=uncultured Microscilla sp. TaxID=432653 RepID=UPI00262566FC|nr:SMC-Scp complex subunit ScpB [uncultured Microscilla sp.]
MRLLQNHVEALIFCASEPISIDELQSCLSELFDTVIPEEEVLQTIEVLTEKYENGNFAFQICQMSEGYQFLTKPEFQPSIAVLLKQNSKKRLSKAALETLAIIAYKQPITKGQLEQIRGVSCDYTIQKLLEKELVAIKGKAETAGRPILYGTSKKFMEYFGINSLSDLPLPKDLKVDESKVPQANENIPAEGS